MKRKYNKILERKKMEIENSNGLCKEVASLSEFEGGWGFEYIVIESSPFKGHY